MEFCFASPTFFILRELFTGSSLCMAIFHAMAMAAEIFLKPDYYQLESVATFETWIICLMENPFSDG